MAYAGISTLVATEGTARLALAGNLRRDPVRFEATIKEPLRFREAMAALYAVVASDFRYRPQGPDRLSGLYPDAPGVVEPELPGRPSGPISPGCCATTRWRS